MNEVRVRAGSIALVVGGLVFVGKLSTWLVTDSSAVFSDAMESVVNVIAGALLLYSLIVAARPADRDHPYGHGKVEFFSAGVEGALIAVAAVLIVVEAARDLSRGPELRSLDTGLIAVTVLAAVNAALGLYLLRVGRRTNSTALIADGRHVLTDVMTSVGVLVGLLAVRVTGWTVLDPLVAIVVAINVLRTGWKLLREAVGGLMDEADEELLSRVVASLEGDRRPWWIDVHTLRAWRSGSDTHVDLHTVVPRYFDAERLHQVGDGLEQCIRKAVGGQGDAIVHFDPCRPRHCEGCAMPDCAVRGAPLTSRAPFTLVQATRGDEAIGPPP